MSIDFLFGLLIGGFGGGIMGFIAVIQAMKFLDERRHEHNE